MLNVFIDIRMGAKRVKTNAQKAADKLRVREFSKLQKGLEEGPTSKGRGAQKDFALHWNANRTVVILTHHKSYIMTLAQTLRLPRSQCKSLGATSVRSYIRNAKPKMGGGAIRSDADEGAT